MPDRRPLAVVTNWRDLEHPQAGGAELVCDRLAQRLVQDGYRVVLLAAAVAGRPASESVNGYVVKRRGGQFSVYAWALVWLLLHRRAVTLVVDSQNGIPFFSPLVLRRTTVCLLLLHHVHQDQFSLYFPRPVAAFGRFLEGPVSRRVYGERAILAVSPSTRQGVRQILRLRGAITVTPPGWEVTIDLDEQRPAKTTHPSLVSVGRLVPHKRTDLTIRAFAQLRGQLPDLTLDVVGGGTELDALRRLAEELGVAHAVRFRPQCSNEERDAVLAASWLCINASEGEGWGISVIEANALGTPVLAYARPGLRDSIHHGQNGWLIDDDRELAEAAAPLLGSLSDARSRESFVRSCHEWAMRFTWEEMGRRVAEAAAIESRRLTLGHTDRRQQADLSTVVRIPASLVPLGWDPRLRDGDVLVRSGSTIELYLPGTDTAAAARVLERLDVPHATTDPRIQLRVATRRDHLAPLAG